jgi:hypothetical protein
VTTKCNIANVFNFVSCHWVFLGLKMIALVANLVLIVA